MRSLCAVFLLFCIVSVGVFATTSASSPETQTDEASEVVSVVKEEAEEEEDEAEESSEEGSEEGGEGEGEGSTKASGKEKTHPHIPPGMFLSVLIGVMLCAQMLLHHWKKTHYRSFQQTTLSILWLLPFAISVFVHFWRMVAIWSVFTVATLRMVWISTRFPMGLHTPRRIYSFFFTAFKICNFLSLAGYVFLVSSVLHPFAAFGSTLAPLGGLMVFYGLYFGVLGRDCAEMCADRIAASMGYSVKGRIPDRGINANQCYICGERLLASVRLDETAPNERSIRINCGHVFHEMCLRGWSIVGKKDVCPYCSEKVQMRGLIRNVWDTPFIFYAQVLDGMRYMVVWNPVILVFANTILWLLSEEQPPHAKQDSHAPAAHEM